MATIYLALGTNLGDRADNLRRAVEEIGRIVTITAVSSTYETAAWGIVNQPDFLNSCLTGTTTLAPHDLLDELKRIEGEIGRQKTFRWGPRLIDIDILFYDDIIIESDRLTIPHPRITERLFVLEPLCEIAADLIHPIHNKTIAQLLQTHLNSATMPSKMEDSQMSKHQTDLIVEFNMQDGVQPVAINIISREELTAKSQAALDNAMDAITEMAERVNSLRERIPSEFSQVEVQFGVKLDWEVGALLSKAGAEANINVTLTWERKE